MTDALSTSVLEAVRNWAHLILRAQVPDEAEDIAAQVIADLWKYVSSADFDGDPQAVTVDEAKAIASNIIRWRVADHYRSAFASRINYMETLPEVPAADSSPEQKTHIQGVLASCVSILANYPDKDRELILSKIATGKRDAMTPAERQRLRRLITRLKSDLERHYQTPVDVLLSE